MPKYGIMMELVSGEVKDDALDNKYLKDSWDQAAAIAEEWTKDPEVKAAWPKAVYSEDERTAYYANWAAAVKAYGERETLELIEEVLLGGSGSSTKAELMQQHDGFQVLSKTRQARITKDHDSQQIQYMARMLLSSLTRSRGLRAVPESASNLTIQFIVNDIKRQMRSEEVDEEAAEMLAELLLRPHDRDISTTQ